MLFNIVSGELEKLNEKENPTYDEIIRFIRDQMNIISPLLTYIDDDGKSYYVNCTNDINEIRKKLSIIKKVNLYITLQSWTCGFCTYEENTEEKCAKQKYITFLAESNIKTPLCLNNIEPDNIVLMLILQKLSHILLLVNQSKTYIQSHIKTDHSISTKFSDLNDSYPTIMNQISNQDLLSRPLKFNFNELSHIIEEIYQRKFIDDTNSFTKYQNVSDISFPDYVYNFLFQKFKHSKNQQIINFLASVDLHSLKKKDINLFQSFLKQHTQEVLTFYLFTRVVIQIELNLSFYHPLRKQCIDSENLQLNQKQVQKILELLFNSEDKYQEFKKYFKGNIISVSDFTSAALHIYEIQHQTHKQKPFQYQIKQHTQAKFTNITNNFDEYQVDSPLFAQSEITTDQQQDNILHQLIKVNRIAIKKNKIQKSNLNLKKEMKTQILFNNVQMRNQKSNYQALYQINLKKWVNQIFEQKIQSLEELQNSIDGIMTSLLDAIYKFDKLLWLNKQPNDIGLEYIENLQKIYRNLSKSKQPLNEDLDKFCSQLMQTPELAKQIENELPWLGE